MDRDGTLLHLICVSINGWRRFICGKNFPSLFVGRCGNIEISLYLKGNSTSWYMFAIESLLILRKLIRILWKKVEGWLGPLYLTNNIFVGFFYGASQCEGSKCGACVVLNISNYVSFKVKMNCGWGTNSRGELWNLFFARYKHVSKLQIVGD